MWIVCLSIVLSSSLENGALYICSEIKGLFLIFNLVTWFVVCMNRRCILSDHFFLLVDFTEASEKDFRKKILKVNSPQQLENIVVNILLLLNALDESFQVNFAFGNGGGFLDKGLILDVKRIINFYTLEIVKREKIRSSEAF